MRCPNCRVIVRDETMVCPRCRTGDRPDLGDYESELERAFGDLAPADEATRIGEAVDRELERAKEDTERRRRRIIEEAEAEARRIVERAEIDAANARLAADRE